MGQFINEITDHLNQRFPDSEVDVYDLTGTQDHLGINIKSSAFAGKSLLEQHQLVMNTLKEKFSQGLHAVKIKTSTK